MTKTWILAVLVLVISSNANAMDHRSQFGFGSSLGANFPAPWGSDDFKSATAARFPAAGLWARYIPGTPEIGLELAYNFISLGNKKLGPTDFSANALILEFISRQNPWGSFHPFYGFGLGDVRTNNKFQSGDAGKNDDPIFKITAGIEFELNDRTDVGLRIDHFSIFRDTNTQSSMHILSPSLSFNYYFGKPAPIPPAAPPEAAPVAAPAPAVTAPSASGAITPPPSQEMAPKSAKSSAKAKKAKKKKKKKKKVTGSAPETPESDQ